MMNEKKGSETRRVYLRSRTNWFFWADQNKLEIPLKGLLFYYRLSDCAVGFYVCMYVCTHEHACVLICTNIRCNGFGKSVYFIYVWRDNVRRQCFGIFSTNRRIPIIYVFYLQIGATAVGPATEMGKIKNDHAPHVSDYLHHITP